MEKKEIPLTVYGLIARKYNTSEVYVGQVVRKERKALRGKGADIRREWLMLVDSPNDWITSFKADGTMIVHMDDSDVSVYVQKGIARVYKKADLKQETEVGYMSLKEFNYYLNSIRIEFK